MRRARTPRSRAARRRSTVLAATLRRGVPSSLLLFLIFLACLLTLILANQAGATPSTTSTAPGGNPPTTTSSLILKGQVKQDYESLQAQADAAQAEIERLDVEIAQVVDYYNELEERLNDLNSALVQLRRRLKVAQDSYRYRDGLINRRLAAVYKAGEGGGLLEILFLSNNLSDFMKRAILVFKATERDQALAEGFENSAREIEEIEDAIRLNKSQTMTLQQALEEKRIEIEGLLTQREQTLASLDERIATLLEEERIRQEEERKRLEAELRARLAAQPAPSSGVPLPENADAVARQLVETAARYLGIPYKWGGKLPSTGLDCSGLTRWVYLQHGVELRYWSRHQAQMGTAVAPADIKTGDLVAFGNPVHHVGIYIGDDRFIHAPRTGDVVKVSVLSKRKDLSAVRRFPLQPRVGPPTWR